MMEDIKKFLEKLTDILETEKKLEKARFKVDLLEYDYLFTSNDVDFSDGVIAGLNKSINLLKGTIKEINERI